MRANHSICALICATLACVCGQGSAVAQTDDAFDRRVRELEGEVSEDEAPDFDEKPAARAKKATLKPRRAKPAAPASSPPFETGEIGLPGLQIYVFDLGQADSMLLVGPGPAHKTLLVDLGEEVGKKVRKNYIEVATRILEITGDETLDYFLASHFHGDHVGGAKNGVAGLLDGIKNHQFKIGTFIDAGDLGAEYMGTKRFSKMTLDANLARWTKNGTVSQRVRAEIGDQQIDLGPGVKVEIVAVAGKAAQGDDGALAKLAAHPKYGDRYTSAPASENDLSIAIEVSCGDFEIFSGGDLTGYDKQDFPDFVPLFTPRSHQNGNETTHETYTNVEAHLLRKWTRETDVEVYRVNHHGSQYSTSDQFLQALDPEVAIFSTGAQYGHPASRVVSRVERTADQFATTRVANEQAWKASGGHLVGEVAIVVDPKCKSYSVNGMKYAVFADADEAKGADQQ